VSLDQYERYAFAMERRSAGLKGPAISEEWDRTQSPAKPYGGGDGYKRFWNDVNRTKKKEAAAIQSAQRRAAARRAAEELYPVIGATLREAAARLAGTLDGTPK